MSTTPPDDTRKLTPATAQQTEERFEQLESKVLYQDRTVDELNTVVTRQQDQIDLLVIETKRLRELIESGAQGVVEAGDEPPPPHY